MTDYAAIDAATRARHLEVLRGFHVVPEDQAPPGALTMLLLGPHEPGFWAAVTAAPEFSDERPDPMDRWSERVISALAREVGASPVFPFGGPPYQPFIAWAQRTGQMWTSPVMLLVHDRQGLMVSIRGALALPDRIDLPYTPDCPCNSCDGQPCRTACPFSALGPNTYDTDACHAHLDTAEGHDCLSTGCLARRACPVSRCYGRVDAQSAFHMRQFHR